MDTAILIGIIIVLVLAFGIFVLLINKKLTKLSQGDLNNTSTLVLQNQINSVMQNLDYKLAETNKIINEQLNLSNQRLHSQSAVNNELLQKINANNTKVLQELTEKLTKVEDTNNQVISFAEQLQSLENILKSPKQRGIYGEYFLDTILSNVLPSTNYKTQYPFVDGTIVDAIILAKDKIIPIDAKFSLEGYNRLHENNEKSFRDKLEKEFIADVKKRIDETSKYVKPEEGTIDVAFMFVPADGVYHEIMRIGCNQSPTLDIINYAYSKKVVIVSPTSFFAYLQTVLQALNSMKIEARVAEIVKYINESSKYLKQFEEEMNRLGKNISTVVNTFNRTSLEARKLSTRISKISGKEEDILALERIAEETVD